MNPKINAPAFPPQILLDQFQRPVAPIPGATMLEVFSLQIFCNIDKFKIEKNDDIIEWSIKTAKLLLDALHKEQSESQIETLKIINNETE